MRRLLLLGRNEPFLNVRQKAPTSALGFGAASAIVAETLATNLATNGSDRTLPEAEIENKMVVAWVPGGE